MTMRMVYGFSMRDNFTRTKNTVLAHYILLTEINSVAALSMTPFKASETSTPNTPIKPSWEYGPITSIDNPDLCIYSQDLCIN